MYAYHIMTIQQNWCT